MIQPCPNPLNCLDAENPVANLTAEDPDQLKCFRFAFTPSSSYVCEFPITLCNDFAAIGGDVGILCVPPPGIINGTNPPAPIIYSSNAQSCIVDCGFSETYEVAPGTFVGLSQANADARAHAFACQLAATQCDGSATSFTSAAQTCTGTCPDGTAVSYTTPAGFFSALSQAEADFQAVMFACEVAALLCASQPPEAFSSSAGVPRTAPVQPLYANFAQSCSSACASGGNYTYTIPGGTYLRESRAAANAVAFSAACNQANLRRVCLSDLPPIVCVGEFVGEFMEATGLAAPVSFAVISGALPSGLTLGSDGFLQGVPTIAGTYAFMIRATGSDGNFTQRTYGMDAAGIDNVILPDATQDEPYAEALTQTGMGGSVTWSVSDGVLPAGIALAPFTGVLSGTATESGDFPFTVSITNGTTTCSKDFTLTVSATGFGWWEMEEAAGDRIDSIEGIHLAQTGAIGGGVTRVAGKINFAAQISATGAAGDTIRLTGNGVTGIECPMAVDGMTLCGWLRRTGDALDTVLGLNTYGEAGAWQMGLTCQDINVWSFFSPDFASTVVATPTGAWQFFIIDFDPGTGLCSFEWDRNGTVYTVLNSDPVPATIKMALRGSCKGRTPAGTTTAILGLDEIAIFPFVLTTAQKNYLFNGGAGRTLPISLP